MDLDRDARIWRAISAVADGQVASSTLLDAMNACVQLLSAAGAGLALTSAESPQPVMATDAMIAELDELQFTLGEGPSGEAVTSGACVLEADLSGAAAGRRWPSFAAAATERRVHGLFAFPVHAGAAKLGVLSVYRYDAGPLDADQLRNALVCADIVFALALDHTSGVTVELDEVIETAFATQHRNAEVHQAAGYLAAQADIGVADALARLRAHAYSSGVPLHEVAIEVMAGRLRLG